MWVGASRTCVNQSESDESNSWLHVYAALIARCTAPVEAEGVCDLPPNQKLVDVLGLATPGVGCRLSCDAEGRHHACGV